MHFLVPEPNCHTEFLTFPSSAPFFSRVLPTSTATKPSFFDFRYVDLAVDLAVGGHLVSAR
jgi:hypothetical protein